MPGAGTRKGTPMLEIIPQDLPNGSKALVFRPTIREITLPEQTSDLKAAIVRGLQDTDCRIVVMDLERIQHAGTDFFALLLAIQKRLVDGEQDLRICNVEPTMEQSLRLCMLHRIFSICPCLEDALKPPADR